MRNRLLLPSSLLVAAAFSLLSGSPVEGALIYQADFTPDGVGFTHTTSNVGSLGTSGSDSTSNFTLSYSETPASDSTINEFVTHGGQVKIQDWGGEGQGTSSAIDVSSTNFVDINLVATELGEGANSGSEFFSWFYQLDSDPVVNQVFSNSTPTSLSHTWSSIDTSSASALTIGFSFDANGQDDGFLVGSMSVSAVPEPSTILSLSAMFGALFFLAWRRWRTPVPEVS